jgi:hypothetical protein
MQGPTRKNDPSQASFETQGKPFDSYRGSQGKQGRRCGAPEKPRKSRPLVVRPREDMRANFLGMTAVSLFVRGAKTRCAAPHVKTTLGKTSKGLRSAAENAADLSYIETAKNDPVHPENLRECKALSKEWLCQWQKNE